MQLLQELVVLADPVDRFGRHGGASGALAHASSFGKPMVVSTVLADQVPASDAVLFVEPGDVSGLRRAIDEAVRSSDEFRALARKSLAATQDRHSYDRHLFRMLETWRGAFFNT